MSSIQTRDVAEQEFTYDKFPLAVSSKPEMLFDISPLIERPIVLDTITWQTTDTRFKLLKQYQLMSDLFSSTDSLSQYFKSYAFFRCHACVYVTVTGTINHQGILLAGVIPDGYLISGDYSSLVNTLMASPHAMLGANEATSSCIEVPFYVPTDYLTLDATKSNDPSNPDLGLFGKNPYANLLLLVINPLATGGTASTSISVHVQVKINKFEVYTQVPSAPVYVNPPTALVAESMIGKVVTSTLDKTSSLLKETSNDFIDALRGVVKNYTGLHNPNNPNLEIAGFMQTRNRANIVDAPSYYEKMDPYSKFTRLTKDAIFHTEVDEMDMNYILSKPQYVGSFKVTTANTTGTLVWARPISPWQGGCYGGQALTSNIERLYYNTQAWSGDMEIIVQSSMTNKQHVKLLVAKLYGLDRRILTQNPTYDSVRTGITTLLEFSAGNQQLPVDLDFLSRNQILYNTIDQAANTMLHGMYYIFVAQPLVVSDSVPTTVEFNVFLRCKPNFRFYGYGMRPGYTTSSTVFGPFIPFPPALERLPEEEDLKTLVAESLSQPIDSAKVMNEPSSSQELNSRDTSGVTPVQPVVERMYPVQNLRDLIRRVQYTGRITIPTDTRGIFTLQYPVAAFAGLFPQTAVEQSPNQNLLKMFAAHNLGMRIKIRSYESANYFIQYYPPTMINNASGSPPNLSGFLYTNTISNSSPYINLVKGPVSGAPFMEMPTMWLADIKSGETGSVMDLHIPHTTMYNWWGGVTWSSPTYAGFDSITTLINANGYLLFSGVGTPSSAVSFEIFMGVDDETRLGFQVTAPIEFLPLNPDKLSYALPERIPVGLGSQAIFLAKGAGYYTNLKTTYDTPL